MSVSAYHSNFKGTQGIADARGACRAHGGEGTVLGDASRAEGAVPRGPCRGSGLRSSPSRGPCRAFTGPCRAFASKCFWMERNQAMWGSLTNTKALDGFAVKTVGWGGVGSGGGALATVLAIDPSRARSPLHIPTRGVGGVIIKSSHTPWLAAPHARRAATRSARRRPWAGGRRCPLTRGAVTRQALGKQRERAGARRAVTRQ